MGEKKELMARRSSMWLLPVAVALVLIALAEKIN